MRRKDIQMGQILQTRFGRRTVDSNADKRRGATEAKGRIQVQTPCSNDEQMQHANKRRERSERNKVRNPNEDRHAVAQARGPFHNMHDDSRR
jgi:hypothetical protein